MKYQGVVELSVREYLGIEDGLTAWRHQKYAIGIKINGEVYDYKTLEKYDFIDRTEKGVIDLDDKKLEKGFIYAINTQRYFEENKRYSDSNIKRYIEDTPYYSEEYKEIKPKVKKLIKQ